MPGISSLPASKDPGEVISYRSCPSSISTYFQEFLSWALILMHCAEWCCVVLMRTPGWDLTEQNQIVLWSWCTFCSLTRATGSWWHLCLWHRGVPGKLLHESFLGVFFWLIWILSGRSVSSIWHPPTLPTLQSVLPGAEPVRWHEEGQQGSTTGQWW